MRKMTLAAVLGACVVGLVLVVILLWGQRDAAGPAAGPGILVSASAGELKSADAGDPGKADNGRAATGVAAIERAAKAGKYLFVFFYKEESEKTGEMRKVFHAAMDKASDRADWVEVKAADPSEKAIVDKFGVGRAPMPLALALAPNGAVTGGFPVEFDEKRLLQAIASPGLAQCLKGLQQRKLVFVCVQNQATKSNEAAMQGVRDFEADPRYTGATEVVTLDPAKSEEAKLLGQLSVDPDTKEAVTVLLAPPGAVLGTCQGATSKSQIVAMLDKAKVSCGSGGCGPSSGAG
jgi:hypothetical protein